MSNFYCHNKRDCVNEHYSIGSFGRQCNFCASIESKDKRIETLTTEVMDLKEAGVWAFKCIDNSDCSYVITEYRTMKAKFGLDPGWDRVQDKQRPADADN